MGLKFAFLSAGRTTSIGRRVAVVGAGPAGLSAAGYLASRNYEVDVYDRLPAPGGLMMFAIPSHRIPPKEIIDGCEDLEKNFGVKFYLRRGVGLGRSGDVGAEFVSDVVALESLAQDYDAVLVATGTWRERRLNIPGEEARGVLTALGFLYRLKLLELGYSAERLVIGDRVIVIGGGLSAVDAAEAALAGGAGEVYLAYRRSIREAPAGPYRIRELVRRGVVFLELVQPARVVAENGFVKAIEFTRVKLGEPDESGRPRPVPIPGSEFTIEVDTVVVAVGELPTPPESSLLANYVREDGRVVVDSSYRVPGTNLFAAGDVVSGPTKIGHAVDSALKAARSVDAALSGEAPSIKRIVESSPTRELVLSLAKWDESLGKLLCGFLEANASISPAACLSSSPFLRVFDYTRCIGCETCSYVCGFVHDGKALIKMRSTAEGLVFPTACLHCANAKCASVCKRNAVTRGPLGEILIDYSKCNSCLDCFHACFIRAMRIREGSVANCDLCRSLRERGLEPACVSMCPSRAITLRSR